MALPFITPKFGKKPEQVIAVDVGSRVTKAVCCESKGDKFVLHGYSLMDAPIYEKTPPPVELLGEHLKSLIQNLNTRSKTMVLAIGAADCMVRHVEMPEMPVEAMRQVLKNNSRNYLQQDLPGHVFDGQVIYQAVPVGMANRQKPGVVAHQQRLVIAGAKESYVNILSAAGRAAGVNISHIIPGMICPINAFELAQPEAFKNDVVALIEVGFKCTTIGILQQGELVLSRVVNMGGDRMTSAIAEEMKINYAEAEGIKIGMPSEIQSTLEAIVAPLGRELRASIDFFEHQQDRMVSRIYVAGGPTRSDIILQFLRNEMMADCVTWNPASFVSPALPALQTADFEEVAPKLGVAIGAAIAAL